MASEGDRIARGEAQDRKPGHWRTVDGGSLRAGEGGHVPARPAPYASDPVFVHRLAPLLRASSRPRFTAAPLRFAITSRPSRCEEDLHLQAGEHARHTQKRRRETGALRTFLQEKRYHRLPFLQGEVGEIWLSTSNGLLLGSNEMAAAVLLVAVFGGLHAERLFLAEADGVETVGGNTQGNQVLLDGACTAVSEG
jgi:hypothetical protein